MTFEKLVPSFSLKKLPHSEVEFSGEIPADVLADYRERALAHIAGELELPGFRKGNVPLDIALKKVGEMAVLEEAAELAVRDLYPDLVRHHKIDVVSRPDIRVTKLAPGNPLALTIRTAVYPEVDIPRDWKALAQKIPLEASAPATDEEVGKTLESLRQSRRAPGGEGTPGEEELPALEDEFAQTLGAFADLADLKAKIREGLSEEKKRAARDKRRGDIIDALLKKTKADLPDVFVDSELEKILAQLKDDVARFGRPFAEYLAKIGKTEEALRAEFKEQAEKRARLQLALNELAEREKIEADEAAVDEEMKHALQHFPDAKPDLLRIHIATVLRNERVLRALEGSDGKIRREG